MDVCETVLPELLDENAENWKGAVVFYIMLKDFTVIYSYTNTQFIWKRRAKPRWLQVGQNFSWWHYLEFYELLNHQGTTSFCQAIFLKEVIFRKLMPASRFSFLSFLYKTGIFIKRIEYIKHNVQAHLTPDQRQTSIF